MKALDRFFLIVFAFFVTAAMLCIGACLWVPNVQAFAVSVMDAELFIKLAVSAILLLIIVYAIGIMFIGTGKSANASTLAARTDGGGIYITIGTINELAVKAAKKAEGVREALIKTDITEKGARIAVKASLLQSAIIPEVSASIQKNIKSDIEALCGIAVVNVAVQIDNSLDRKKQ